MEIVNWIDHSRLGEDRRGDLTAWLILHAISEQKDVMKQLEAAGFKSDALEIEFKINGIELPFVGTLTLLENHLDWMVAQKAKALIKEKFGNLDDTLYSFHEMLKDALTEAEQKVRKEFNLPFDTD